MGRHRLGDIVQAEGKEYEVIGPLAGPGEPSGPSFLLARRPPQKKEGPKGPLPPARR
jgi:hypothetical protein